MSDLLLENAGPAIKVLRLNRPERLNALTNELVEAIRDNILACGRDEHCRVVIITGQGRGFCAGLDLVNRAGKDFATRTVADALDGQEQFASMVQAMRTIKQPVIAAVNGPCAGAGFALALGADIRVAAQSAKFHVAAIKIGLSAGECGISYHLPRLIGAGRAFEVMLTGRPIDAAEAERIGLVSRSVPDGDVFATAVAIAEQICANSPFAVRQTKKVMWRNLDASSLDAALDQENTTQILATRTDDFKEATTAFSEKRPPRFEGR